MKKLFIYLFMVLSSLSMAAQTIDVKGESVPLDHFWSVGVGAGRVNEGLRASWLEHLKESKKHCGFQYVRMHGLFCDDMCIYTERKNGDPVYNWQYVDDVYDRMLSIGVRPFVELSFFPKGIAADTTKIQMWYRNLVTPDRERYGKWHDLVQAFTQHVVDRYGLDEVNKWYFEVWNEPNLTNGFFDGSKSDYFELYRVSADAVKSVSPTLKVGGPATSNFIADGRHDGERYDHSKSRFFPQDKINKQQWKGIWIEEFLKFCEKENLPLDFISTHPYPTDYALDPVTNRSKGAIRYVNSLHDDISWLKKTLAKSKYPDAEIHLTEWSTSPNSRDAMHDVLPPAAYIMKTNLECAGMAQSLMYWTFTDVFEEKGAGETPFHGGFGMINYQGIVKPTFHAYRMMNQLGDEKLYYADPLFVSRSSNNGKITALAFNYPEEYLDNVPSTGNVGNYMNASGKKINVTFTGFKPGTCLELELLDDDHGNVINDYKAIGSPRTLTLAQTEHLKDKAWGTQKKVVKADGEGKVVINEELSPWACMMIKEL